MIPSSKGRRGNERYCKSDRHASISPRGDCIAVFYRYTGLRGPNNLKRLTLGDAQLGRLLTSGNGKGHYSYRDPWYLPYVEQ